MIASGSALPNLTLPTLTTLRALGAVSAGMKSSALSLPPLAAVSLAISASDGLVLRLSICERCEGAQPSSSASVTSVRRLCLRHAVKGCGSVISSF